MKKRLVATILCATMALSMVACGKATVVETQSSNVVANETVYMPMPTAAEAKVQLCDYENLEIRLEGDFEVSQEVVNYLANNVMSSYGLSSQPVTDRDEIAEGDLVMVDYTGYKDGEAFQGGAATDQLLDVSGNCMADGSTGFIPGFTDGLFGKKVGETVRYEVPFPADYGNADLAGQTTEFEFVIKGIYKNITLDELTDDMVKDALEENFGVATVDDFMAYIKAYLVSSSTFDYVNYYIMENSSCEVPSAYLDYVADLYMNYLANRNFGSMEALTSYYQGQGMDINELIEGVRGNIENDIKSQIIFAALADAMGIQITEDQKKEMLSGYLVENGGQYASEEEVVLEMGLGNKEFGEEYLLNQCTTSEVVTKIVSNSTVYDADGNKVSE